MASKDMKRCLTSLDTREIHIKTAMRYHFRKSDDNTRMAKSKSQIRTSAGEDVEKSERSYSAGGNHPGKQYGSSANSET